MSLVIKCFFDRGIRDLQFINSSGIDVFGGKFPIIPIKSKLPNNYQHTLMQLTLAKI
jgi:hypothetical protein